MLVSMRLFALLLLLGACKSHKSASTSADPMASMAKFKDRMCACKDAACARSVSAEMADWSRQQPASKPAALTPEQQQQANELGTQIGECMMRATTADVATGSSAGSGSASGSGSDTGAEAAPSSKPIAGVPSSCSEYKAAVDKLATCDKISKAAREQLQQGYANAAKGWAATPEAARGSLEEACKAGRDSVLAAGKAQCGW